MTLSRGRLALGTLASLTFVWVIVRAQVQSITIDEADTFLVWVSNTGPVQWTGASNNHVLNTLMMRLSVAVFGTSHLSVRFPALLGAALYISASVAVCLKLYTNTGARLTLFGLLALNPMVLDYLVAARGYGMALGFLLWAVYLMISDASPNEPDGLVSGLRNPALSCCLALCFASSFAFAWVCCSIFLLAAAPLVTKRAKAKSLVGLILPGAALSLVLSSYPALTMRRSELRFGTNSLGHMFTTLQDSFISQPNPNLANPWLLGVLEPGRRLLMPGILIALAGALILVSLHRNIIARQHLNQLGLFLSLLGMTVLLHYAAYRAIGVLLPQERTALFFLPLSVLLISCASTICLPSLSGMIWQRGFRILLAITVVYFVFCLRLTWFQEWMWDAETRQAYNVAAWWAKRCGESMVPASWHYVPSLNFYKTMSGSEALTFRNKDEVVGRASKVYVLYDLFDQPLVASKNLKVVWQGWSGVIVAISPERTNTSGHCPAD